MAWFDKLTDEDYNKATAILGGCRAPDLVIAPDGEPYIYRWHLVRSPVANVYFHIQVADDPERPLHDHPWDNVSVIVAGGYKELISHTAQVPTVASTIIMLRNPGDVIWRAGAWPHRLLLRDGVPYTMTIFTTGPKVREWGFWTKDGWVNNHEMITTLPDGRSVFKGEMM